MGFDEVINKIKEIQRMIKKVTVSMFIILKSITKRKPISNKSSTNLLITYDKDKVFCNFKTDTRTHTFVIYL